MSDLVAGPVRVRVPATSANLGPGYDALGLALALHDEVSVEVVDGPPGSVRIEVVGEGADTVSLDDTHLVHRCVVRGLQHLGAEAPALSLRCVNAVPHGRGLGSSSAAIVAGLGLARALVGDGAWTDEGLLRLAADIEGHPDNVAPAVLGGLTVAFGATGAFDAVRLDVAPGPAFVVLVPPDPLATTVARGLLPDRVPHADAAHAAGRSALLVACLTQGPDAVHHWRERLLAATEDRLHQTPRAPAMPASAALVADLRARGIAAVVSGAGPSVLAVADPGEVDDVVAAAPEGWWARALEVDAPGLTTLP